MPNGYLLRLYSADRAADAQALAVRLKELLSRHHPGEHEVEVIDVLMEPARAAADRIFVTPTLIKASPAPSRRVIGDLSDLEKVLALLGVPAEPGGG